MKFSPAVSAKALIVCLLMCLVPFPGSVRGQTVYVLETEPVTVMAEEPLKGAAERALELYPAVKEDLERRLGLRVTFAPTILLVGERERFRKMAGSDLFVAFAVPERNLMVIDHSHMSLSPFSLAVTMKHELCHLLLNHFSHGRKIPRWFEEGIAQWVSEGIGEMIMDYKRPHLNEAVLAGNIIPMSVLAAYFPADRESLSLAYAQSRDFVLYMVERHGIQSILTILEALREGRVWEDAVWDALGVSFLDLEYGWRQHLKKKLTWWTFVANNLYQILFFLAAVASILGFVRAYMRKRAYMREGKDEDSEISRE